MEALTILRVAEIAPGWELAILILVCIFIGFYLGRAYELYKHISKRVKEVIKRKQGPKLVRDHSELAAYYITNGYHYHHNKCDADIVKSAECECGGSQRYIGLKKYDVGYVGYVAICFCTGCGKEYEF